MSARLQAITARKPRRRPDGLILTAEQKAIVECSAECVLVQASAGTGKTTVLKAYAERRPQRRFVYICFNKAIQEAAAKSFPPNVTCVTFDALAYRRYVYGYKIHVNTSGGMRPLNAALVRAMIRGSTFRTRHGERLQVPHPMCRQIALTLESFSKQVIDAKDGRVHTAYVPEEVCKAIHYDKHTIAHIKQLAQWVWRKYLRRDAPHLCYAFNRLVLWAEGLERDIDRDTTLLVDEGQDLNAPMAAALMVAPHRCVVVGDPYQQIYGTFMGSVNVLKRLHKRGTHLFALTLSFRFGSDLASLLSRLLNLMDAHPRVREQHHRRVRIRGSPHRQTRIMSSHEAMETPFVGLFRTNQKLFGRAFMFAKNDVRIHILGWRAFRLQLLAAKDSRVLNSDNDGGVSRILERYEPALLHDAIRAIDAHHVDDEKDADVILSTIHKFKGREAKRVWVHNDIKLKSQFQFQKDDGHVGVVWHENEREEVNLAYVALSRATELLRVDVDIAQYVYEAENVSGTMLNTMQGGVVIPEDTSGHTAIRVKRLGEQPRTFYLLKPKDARRASGGGTP